MPDDPMNETIQAIIEQPETVTWWGDMYTITPRFVDTKLGDQRVLLYFVPLATRPCYYVLRGDSAWIDAQGYPTPAVYDALDAIYESIEDDYGNAEWGDDDADDADVEPRPWPALDLKYGASWAAVEATHPAYALLAQAVLR